MTTSYEKPCDFGHYLQLNRKSKGKSLEEISAVTKIPESCLKQLEEQDLANLPAPVFVKGFVRAYAAAVGADVEDALQRFDCCCAMTLPDQQTVVEDKATSSRYWPRSLLAVVLLAALIFMTLLFFGIMNTSVTKTAPIDHDAKKPVQVDAAPENPSASLPEVESQTTAVPEILVKDTPAAIPPSNDVQAPDMEATEQAVSIDDPGVVDAPAEAVIVPQLSWTLHIRAIEPTWMTVSADGGPPVEMSLKPDEVVRFKASDHFNLFIGNAGGIILTLNDRSIGVPGNSGQVINLRLP
jgi:cytoskeletal protein RodZ